MMYAADFIKKEYEKASQLIEEENSNKRLNSQRTQNSRNNVDENELTDEEYQVGLLRLVYTNEIILDLSLSEKDCYIPNIKRTINQNLPSFLTLISKNYEAKDQFLQIVEENRKTLENLYYDYFNSQTIKISLLEEYVNGIAIKIQNEINSENHITTIYPEFINLIHKEKEIITSPIHFPYKEHTKSNSSNLSKQFSLNKSNIVYTITKIFKLNKDKSLYSDKLCENVIKFCFSLRFIFK